jgi:hypothetical protein
MKHPCFLALTIHMDGGKTSTHRINLDLPVNHTDALEYIVQGLENSGGMRDKSCCWSNNDIIHAEGVNPLGQRVVVVASHSSHNIDVMLEKGHK